MHPALQDALRGQGIASLYSHQAETFAAARARENVVLTTGTASGKSLAYLAPVMQSVLEDATARTILLFPTKALTQDQLRGVLRFIDGVLGTGKGGPMSAGIYDGDTPPAERARVRDSANLLLTNPDMLHSALLPNHGRSGFSHVFRNVRYIVVDELHSYRGAFGAHFANLMRRLRRVCRHYGSDPVFLCSSATIGNARAHAETLCGAPFRLIDKDGSPAAGRVVHFWQPPLDADERRKPVTSEMAALVPRLIEHRLRTIAFCRSRKETEIVLKEARDHLAHVAGHDEADLLAGYRGGYTPVERRAVERNLVEGKLLGVVSTNALELGIDIGELQVVVQGGFPGTRASFWQQMGRAGRRGETAHAILILAVSATDQFIADHPDWLVGQTAEHAVVDPNNLAIQLAHARAAAAELPLTLDDAVLFPDLGEIVGVLQRASEVRDMAGAWHWTGDAFPAGEFSLRNIHNDRFKIVNRQSGVTITEMSRPQVYREAHTRAVYLHDGVQYQVEKLDLVQHVATVTEVEQNFYTQPDVRTAIDVLLTQEERALGTTCARFGDVRVDESVVGYKMLEFHNHQNLGYETLHEALRLQLETEALWIPVPERVLAVLGGAKEDALCGMVHAVAACARMRTMAERTDLVGASFHCVDSASGRTQTALILHDSHPGGLGYAATAYEHVERIVSDAIALVDGCGCKDGCPACVGSYGRDRQLIGWALHGLCRDEPVPEAYRTAAVMARLSSTDRAGTARPRIPWPEVEQRFAEVVARLRNDRVDGAELLAKVARVTCRGVRLVVTVDSPGLAEWLGAEAVMRRLWPAIAALVDTPKDAAMEVRVERGEAEKSLKKSIKLRRRHDDLLGELPTDEGQANDALAGGYLLAQDAKKPS